MSVVFCLCRFCQLAHCRHSICSKRHHLGLQKANDIQGLTRNAKHFDDIPSRVVSSGGQQFHNGNNVTTPKPMFWYIFG